MKRYSSYTRRFFAVVLALAMLVSVAGCERPAAEKGKEALPESPGASQQQEEPQEEQTPDEQAQQEDEASAKVELSDEQLAAPQDEQEQQEQPDETALEESSTQTSTQGLDTQKLGWGPGGPVDAENRPNGATLYQEKYGQYAADFIREDTTQIYLTFDEGYENGYTAGILDTLKEKNVQAVFFVTQPYVESEPELVQRMIDEGHIVGNHSVTHPSFPEISFEECQQEIIGLHNYMKENFGYEMSLFRFPMGEFSEADLKVVQDLGYRSVFWSFAYRDWLVDDQPDPQEAITTIESKCHPGAIYLLHAVSQTNAQILGQVIDDLRRQGYTFCAYQ